MELLVDLCTHTVSSGYAYSTITENTLVASRRGLKLLGMTDHGPSMRGVLIFTIPMRSTKVI